MVKATLGIGLMVFSMFVPADILIQDVRVIDGTGALAREKTSVWVRDGYIQEIGLELTAGESTRLVDGKVMTVIPFLVLRTRLVALLQYL